MKLVLLLSGLLFFTSLNAQRYKIKAGIWGVPLFQSGFGTGTLGFEAFNKNADRSFQLTVSAAGGSIAADAEITSRYWFTVERNIYLYKPEKPSRFFISGFIETGNRKKSPGFSDFPPDSILQNKKAFEINPGLGVGTVLKFRKRWGFDLTAGPKIIFASHTYTYYNSITKVFFTKKYKDVKPGFRLMACFTYRF